MTKITWESYSKKVLLENQSGDVTLITTNHIEHGYSRGTLFTGSSGIISSKKLKRSYLSIQKLSFSLMNLITFGIFFGSFLALILAVYALFDGAFVETIFLGVMFAISIYLNKWISDKAYSSYMTMFINDGWMIVENPDNLSKDKKEKLISLVEKDNEYQSSPSSTKKTSLGEGIKIALIAIGFIILMTFAVIILATIPTS